MGNIPKHIVIISNIPAPYRVDFFDYLKKKYTDYRFTILYSSKNEDNRSWEIDQEKMDNSIFLESKTIKIKKKLDTRYVHIPWGVGKTLKELAPDVVVGSEYNPTILLALHYCKRHKIPFVSWTDGTLFSERNFGKVQLWSRKHVIRRADSYIASSTKSMEAQVAYGAPEEKCHISFLTVDVEKYIQKPQGKDIGKILCVGSLIERKGVDLLLKALAEVKGDFELCLAGTGPEKDALEEMADDLEIADKVHFLGQLNREALLKQYADSDLFILPTREDCFALVILEAMCSKLPIICSGYADGSYDLIKEGHNGFVIDPYDTKSFAACIQKLLDNRELRKALSEHSAEILEKFRFENVSKGYMEAIKECIN